MTMTQMSQMRAYPDGRIATTIGAPAPREPIAITSALKTQGQRVIVQTNEGHIYGVIAVSNPEYDADAKLVVRVCREEAWWRWRILGERPPIFTYPSRAVHLEG